MRNADIPTLVTGLIVTGFALLTAWAASGQVLITSGKTWFSVVLIAAGAIGLGLSLAHPPEDENNPSRRRKT